MLLFVAGSGANLRGQDLGTEQRHDILIMDADGSEAPRRVASTANRGSQRRITRPSFSADGERIWYFDNEGGGGERGERLSWGFGDRVYSMASADMLLSGKAAPRDAGDNGILVLELSIDADGRYGFAGTSRDLDALKPVLTTAWHDAATVRLDVAVADDAPTGAWTALEAWAGETKVATRMLEPAPEDDAQTVSADHASAAAEYTISLEVPRAKPSGSTAFTGARIITMDGDEVIEGGGDFPANMGMLMDGHSGIEHSLSVGQIYKDVIGLFATTRAGYTGTLLVAYGGQEGEKYFFQRDDVWKNDKLQSFFPPRQIDARARRRIMSADDDYNHMLVAAGQRKIAEAGGLVTLGAHGQLQGLGAHWELWAIASGGMDAHDALSVATINGAEYLGMADHLGSLEVGKLADSIVLDDNPLTDVRHSESVRMTIINGVVYDADTMNELWPEPRERGRFHFEQ